MQPQTLTFNILVGLGVDDMFVIVHSLDNLRGSLATEPVHVRVAHGMKHAGVSVTITSITDLVAFGVGATTVSELFYYKHQHFNS